MQRYKAGIAESDPTPRTLGLMKEALDWASDELDWILEGPGSTFPSLAKQRQVEWQDLLEYMRRQANVPYEVQKEKLEAEAALKSERYEAARNHLGQVAELLRGPAAYHAEEYGQALAALGALGFTERDYFAARKFYGEAIRLALIPADRLERYRRSYLIASNACMSEAKTEADARRIMAEMTAQDPPVPPNVVTFSTLMSKVAGLKKVRAVLRLMRCAETPPNEITIISAIGAVDRFEDAVQIADLCTAQGWPVFQGAATAVFAKPIAHLSAAELLVVYRDRDYQYASALANPIRQYRRERRHADAAELTLAAPHIASSQKLFKEWYDVCRTVFDAKLADGCDDDNLYYA